MRKYLNIYTIILKMMLPILLLIKNILFAQGQHMIKIMLITQAYNIKNIKIIIIK